VSAPLLMLKELGTIHTGSTPKTNDESLFGGDVPFVTPGDLDAVSPIQSTPRTLTEAGVKTADLLPAESVLVCCIGSLGKIGFAGRPVVTNQQINAVVFNPAKVHARYGFFACRMLKPQLELMAPATTVPIVNKSRFSELRIPVPPLEEQRRIAAILDQAETLRTQRRQALAHLDTLTQSLFLDMFGDPVANPNGWPTRELQEVVKPGAIVTYGIVQAGDEFPGGIPYIRTGDLVNGSIRLTELRHTDPELAAKFSRSRVEVNEIVMSIRATVGTTALVPAELDGANLTQGTARIAPGEDMHFYYLLYFLRSGPTQHWIDRQVKGATFREITLGRLRELPVLVPPLPLQQTFATRIQAIEALKATHRTALAQLDALFASLQQRAFAGEL
jgi:type I restriction enzyme, S subunit